MNTTMNSRVLESRTAGDRMSPVADARIAAGGRFFRASALAGRLHLRDIMDWESWNPAALKYQPEAEVCWLVRVGHGLHKIARNVDELAQAVQASGTSRGSITVHVHEELLEDVKVRWEEMRRTLHDGPRTPDGAAGMQPAMPAR